MVKIMKKKYMLAIDQSTQGTKGIIFGQAGEVVCRADIPHRQIVDDKGWISHDLTEIWQNVIKVGVAVIEKAGIDKEEIAGIGLSNQRETSCAWDKESGEPLDYAVVWQCARAEKICERIKQNVILNDDRERNFGGNVGEAVRYKTGLNLSPYFPAAKFTWLVENSPAVKKALQEKRLCLGTVDSYLLFRLTKGKVFATDYSNASRTQLFNLETLDWDEEICRWFGLSRELLPEVKDSNAIFGETDWDGYFPEPLPITGVIGDSQGALFGQGCLETGMVKATYGTGSSVMMNVGETLPRTDDGLVTSIGWGIDGKITYVREGNINYSGAVISWLKDDLGLIKSPGETQALAETANASDRTYLVPAFTGLGAPYWNAKARATICGMSRTTGRREIVKAALESIAYQVTDIVLMMQNEGGIRVKELSVDGAPSKNNYLMHFQSDILNLTVTLARCEESSAAGAAYLAGLKLGFYEKEKLLARSERQQFLPQMTAEEREERYNGWREAVENTLVKQDRIRPRILA